MLTSAGWQVTLCDPTWQVVLCSSVTGSRDGVYTPLNFLRVCVCRCKGVVPVTVRPPNLLNLSTTLSTVRMVVEVSKAVAILSTAFIIRVLRSKVC